MLEIIIDTKIMAGRERTEKERVNLKGEGNLVAEGALTTEISSNGRMDNILLGNLIPFYPLSNS